MGDFSLHSKGIEIVRMNDGEGREDDAEGRQKWASYRSGAGVAGEGCGRAEMRVKSRVDAHLGSVAMRKQID